MKIYFLLYSYEVGISANIGGFRKLWELAEGLCRQPNEVRLFLPKLKGYLPLKNIPYSYYPVINAFMVRPISAYVSMFVCAFLKGLREKPDIIYFRGSTNILPVFLARMLGAKSVFELNGSFREFHKTVKVSLIRNFIFVVSEWFVVHLSDKIVVLTAGLKAMLHKHYTLPDSKVVVIPSGTDTDHFRPLNIEKAKAEIGIDAGKKVIGFSGIFYAHQGVDTLIYAAKKILSVYPQSLFLIVGDGIMRKTWEDLARAQGIKESFIFTGQINYEEMPLYFNAMDVVAAPFKSNRGETSPFKVFDALACGKIVVSSAIDSMLVLIDEFPAFIVGFKPEDSAGLSKAVVDALDKLPDEKDVINMRKI